MFQTQRGAALVGHQRAGLPRRDVGRRRRAGRDRRRAAGDDHAADARHGPMDLVQGFAAMTLGGFGSLGGAVAGGMLLGVTEKLLGFYVNTVFIDITAYLVTILVLLCARSGLFGRRAGARLRPAPRRATGCAATVLADAAGAAAACRCGSIRISNTSLNTGPGLRAGRHRLQHRARQSRPARLLQRRLFRPRRLHQRRPDGAARRCPGG